jgi:serine/threonine-protein kinase
MEFLEGKSLERIVQEQGVLTIETILPIYDQVCSALDHAHHNRVVHRDIKPANIMILQSGLVKVTDFGIAKMMAMGMTQAGQVLGTPNYMSPEQVKGRQIDGRSDIFALGVILYELVTGEKPFGGQNITTVIYKIINENPIPPRDLDASIPAGLSYVISKALAKSADERYQTCSELAQDLRNYKRLGGAAIGQGTMILKASPVPVEVAEAAPLVPAQMPPPPASPPLTTPMAVDETPITSSLDIHVSPPPATPQKSIPQVAWVLGALVVVAIMGIISYFFVLRPQGRRDVSPPVVQVAPPLNPQPPITQAARPGPTTAVTAPISGPGPTPAKHELVPPKEEKPRAPAATKMGQLRVSANVTGAIISVDGRSDASWLTPYTFSDLPDGTHNVVISMDGYENFQQSVTIVGGQTALVNGNLSTARAEVDIITEPVGVEVFIDGKSYGPSPIQAILAPGSHIYMVKPAGMAPIEKAFTIKSGEILTKKLSWAGS